MKWDKLFNIKVLLKLPIRTNNNKLRTALGIPDIKIYLSLISLLKVSLPNINLKRR